MKKTLLITSDFWPQTGGVANYWLELGRLLPEDKFIIAAPLFEHKQSEADGVTVKRFKFFAGGFIWPRWLPLFWRILSLVKKEKIEKIIVGQILPIGTVVFVLWKLKLVPDYYVSCHGMDLQILRGRKKKLAKLILKSSAGVIVNSNYTAKLARQLASNAPITKITPSPRLLPAATIDIRKKLALDTDNILLTVSRLVERKGIDKVIEALPQIWSVFPDLVYIVVGDGPDKSRLQKIADSKIPPDKKMQIIWAGKVNDEMLSAFYRAAKIFIMPNREIDGDVEGFGMVFLEAGLFALPVIGGKNGGVVEVIKPYQTGILLDDPSDIKQIADAALLLLQDKDLYNKLSQGNYNFAKSFSWSNEAIKLKKLLSSL